MITAQQLKDYAKASGKSIEIRYPCSYMKAWEPGTISMSNYKRDFDLTVGIELKPGVWYWWRRSFISDESPAFDKLMFFDHRYNMMNGAIQSSSLKGTMAEMQIEDFLRPIALESILRP